jgi:hypothetical protein
VTLPGKAHEAHLSRAQDTRNKKTKPKDLTMRKISHLSLRCVLIVREQKQPNGRLRESMGAQFVVLLEEFPTPANALAEKRHLTRLRFETFLIDGKSPPTVQPTVGRDHLPSSHKCYIISIGSVPAIHSHYPRKNLLILCSQ